MTDIPIVQVYAVVKDALDYSGKRWTDQEVKEFVDRFLAKEPQKPDPKGCIYAVYGRCSFNLADNVPSSSLVCVGLDKCKKAEMLLGVKI